MNTVRFPITFQNRQLQIAAAHRPAGPDLVFFIHGLGCSKSSFRDAWTHPALQGYSLVSVDLLGYGDSPRPEWFSYCMESQAAVCAELLAKLKYEKLHLVGHSMGGAITLLLPDHLLFAAASFANIEGNLIGADCAFASRRTISVPYARFTREILPEFETNFKKYASMSQASPEAYYKSSESLVGWSDSGELLRKFIELSGKKLYFYGDENAGHPTVSAVAGIPSIMISGSGHFPMNDNPADFYAELGRFIAASA